MIRHGILLQAVERPVSTLIGAVTLVVLGTFSLLRLPVSLLPELERLGLRVPVRPDGAFYIYTDIREYSQDSDAFSQQLLHEAGVAAVPGRDFGTAHAPYTLRLSYATGMDRLQEAISRLGQFLGR